MTREYIKISVDEICLYEFDEVDFDGIISKLNTKSRLLKSEFSTMKRIYLELNYRDGNIQTPYFSVIIERLENDKEYNKRIRLEKKEKEEIKTKKEKSEEKEYLRLQKKFGNKV